MSEQYEQTGEQQKQQEKQEQEAQSRVSVEEAHAAVMATEEAVRVAVERAREVTLRLERLGSGRHLAHELATLEAEIERAWQSMHEAEQRAYQLEQAQLSPSTEQPTMETLSDSRQSTPPGTNETPPQQEVPERESLVVEQTEMPQTEQEDAAILTSRMEQIERIEQIDEEEEMVAMAAAMTAADVAAAAAAEAEAFAEASSARVRELRHLTEQADNILEQVRLAIRRGILIGDAAEATLYDAEHDASRVRTLLAEAEATEERARRAAMNAEAEAEVAEGMALATQGRFADEDYRDAGNYALERMKDSYSHNESQSYAREERQESETNTSDQDEGSEEDREDTLKLPSLRLPMRYEQRDTFSQYKQTDSQEPQGRA